MHRVWYWHMFIACLEKQILNYTIQYFTGREKKGIAERYKKNFGFFFLKTCNSISLIFYEQTNTTVVYIYGITDFYTLKILLTHI